MTFVSPRITSLVVVYGMDVKHIEAIAPSDANALGQPPMMSMSTADERGVGNRRHNEDLFSIAFHQGSILFYPFSSGKNTFGFNPHL